MTRERRNRHIIKRIIVRGTLVLDTPTCLGSGYAEGPTDLVLLRDSIQQKQIIDGQQIECYHALLTGSSIAGSLRNHLHEYQGGYEADDQSKLFGGKRSDEDGDQSSLIIDDSVSSTLPAVELRDGVKIDGKTGTAANKAKYDLELLAAGTEFPLCFELLVDKDNENELIQALASALQGLELGEIGIGMKKRRGFGRCHVKEWQVWHFDLQDSGDRMAWLTLDRPWAKAYSKQPNTSESIAAALEITLVDKDKRDRFSIQATFKLASPILIRSAEHSTERTPDAVHLKSKRGEEWQPVVSGTSLAGVLRHRAVRIINTLSSSSEPDEKEPEIIQKLFGFVNERKKLASEPTDEQNQNAQASRLVVHESLIEGATAQNDLVQNRIAIDRFTGGAYHGALFSEQPVFDSGNTSIKLELELRKPQDHEVGLLLLLLKDLWTKDLPVGGTASIGRGRLQGTTADLMWQRPENPKQWAITEKDGALQIINATDPSLSAESVRNELEEFVQALLKHLRREVKV